MAKKFNPLPKGDRPVSSPGFMPEVPSDTRSLEGMQRPLFAEDLNPRENARLEQARRDHTSTFTSRAAAETALLTKASKNRAATPQKRADAANGLKTHELVSSQFRDIDETRDEAASRIANRVLYPNRSLMLRNEGVPGAAWYPEHNGEIRSAIKGTNIPLSHAAVSSGSMSPLNSPDNEVTALRGLAHAHATNAKTMFDEKTVASIRANKAAAPHLTDDMVGRYVGFHEMHPAVVGHLAAISGPQAKSNQIDLDSTMDTASIRRAGTNKDKGVRGIRGATNNELNPPLKAPKVNTYTHNGESFDSSDPAITDELKFRAGDAANRARGLALGAQEHRTPAEEAEYRRLPAPHERPFDFHNTHDDNFAWTHDVAKQVASRGGVQTTARGTAIVPSTRGTVRVAMRDQHPANVMALSHPSNDDQHTRRLAQLSSQHPTVVDSWANAEVHNQPNVSFGDTSVYKAGGSEKMGYWQTKQINNGTVRKAVPVIGADGTKSSVVRRVPTSTSILDKTRPGVAHVGPAALQHTEYDKVLRMAAEKVRDTAQTPYDFPSTITQATPWTYSRREVSGKDSAFEAARDAEVRRGQRPVEAPAPEEHSNLSGQQFTGLRTGRTFSDFHQGHLFG